MHLCGNRVFGFCIFHLMWEILMGRGISQLDMRAREGVALLGTGFLKLDGMFICLFKLSSRWLSLQYDSSIFYLNWHSCSFWCSHLHLDPLWLLVLNIETDKCFAFTCIKIKIFLSKESACLRQLDQNHNSNRQACGRVHGYQNTLCHNTDCSMEVLQPVPEKMWKS